MKAWLSHDARTRGAGSRRARRIIRCRRTGASRQKSRLLARRGLATRTRAAPACVLTSRMSRSTVVYIVMVAVFAAGLWVILGFGNRALRAPEDLAGDWEVRPPDGQGAPATPMRVEQSGRFLKITFGGERKAVTMKMLDDKLADEADSADLRSITLEGDDRQARFRGLHRSDRWSLR